MQGPDGASLENYETEKDLVKRVTGALWVKVLKTVLVSDL